MSEGGNCIHIFGWQSRIWFHGFIMDKKEITWAEFMGLCCRLEVMGSMIQWEDLTSINSWAQWSNTIRGFEDLKSLMLTENPYMTETYSVSSFISGLQEDLKSMVRLLKPTTLLAAFEQA